MPRRKMPKHRLVNFSAKEFPQIMPWFKAQYNQKLSVYLLIRMAQRVGGNKDWPAVMQNLTSSLVVHDSLMNTKTGRPNYRFQAHEQPAHPYYTERRTFLKHQAEQSVRRPDNRTPRPNVAPKSSNINYDMGTVNTPDSNTKNNKVSNQDLKGLGIKHKW